jgi:hypothetical protein
MNIEIMKQTGFEQEVKLVEQGQCPLCYRSIEMDKFRDELSKKEFEISGLCQQCQDEVFTEEDYEPEVIHLTDGRGVVMGEENGPGMAGEPCTYVFLKIGEEPVRLEDIKDLMSPEDYESTRKYLDLVSESNEASSNFLDNLGRLK